MSSTREGVMVAGHGPLRAPGGLSAGLVLWVGQLPGQSACELAIYRDN